MIIIFDDEESREMLSILHSLDPDDPRPYPMRLTDPDSHNAVVAYVMRRLRHSRLHKPIFANTGTSLASVQFSDNNLILSIGEFHEQYG